MAIALVQSTWTQVVAGPGSTIALVFPSSVTTGNLIDVVLTWSNGSSEAPGSCADTTGSNTYTEITNCRQYWSAESQLGAVFYAKNVTGGFTTVTLTLLGSRYYIGATASEWSGLDTTAPLDQSTAANGTSTSPSTGSVTTGAAGELILSSYYDTEYGNNAITAESTALENHGTTDGSGSQYEVQGSAGSIAGDFTVAAAHGYIAMLRTYVPTFTATYVPPVQEFTKILFRNA